jgi:type I site-specific restriction endonuclease
VLFLCDRKELRVQADDAFKQNLPSEPRCVIGETGKVELAWSPQYTTFSSLDYRHEED